MRFVAAIALAALTACGVDGPPERPSPRVEQQIGVKVTGETRIGVEASL